MKSWLKRRLSGWASPFEERFLQLSQIYASVQEDLAGVERQLRSVSEVDFSELAELLSYILTGGKGIRPALTLLTGKFYHYNPDLHLHMATAVELMHTATLVHDDAIDNSLVRRGRPTINSLWGEDRAVLLGDYLFAKAGEFAAATGNLRVIRLFALTLQIISSGEISQTFDAYNLEQTRDHYLERISSKTASLFSLATESGAILSQAPEESIQILKEYGFNLGIAFQIIDDLLDFVGTEEEMGKPIGSDLAQGTFTLPAMLLLEHYPDDNLVKGLFSDHDIPKGDKQKRINQAIDLVRHSSIVQECYEVASDYCAKACHRLGLLPASPSRQALKDLADLVISRRK
jgi:geranylgeranyl pyrophosphate synthase